MNVSKHPNINLYHGDCMEAMKDMPDNAYDLAIVDPPYFSGPEKRKYYGSKVSGHGVKRIDYKPLKTTWQVPDSSYYKLLHVASKDQIIWGINYYPFINEVSPGRIIWDKHNDSTSFSDFEIASCSKIETVRVFRFLWSGMMQGSKSNGSVMEGDKSKNEKKIHPTQKPTQLYRWLLKKYSKSGDKILDTHGGSMSIAIACYDLGFDLDLWEIDEDYYKAGVERVKKHIAQGQLFNPAQQKPESTQLTIDQ